MVAVVSTTLGSKIYISDGSVTNATDTAGEYAALTWIEIAGVSNLDAFGDQSQEIRFDVIGEGRTRKQKGSRDAGNMNVEMAFDPNDAGQQELVTAEASNSNWAFKVEFNDKLTVSGTNTIQYFRAKVMSKRATAGTANNVITRTAILGIDSEIIEVAAT